MATKPCRIPEVDYDRHFADFLYTSAPGLAGVFHLPTTRELWDLFLHDRDTKPILEDWVDERKRLGLPAYKGIHHKHLSDILADPRRYSILFAESHPAFSSPGRALGKIDIRMLARFAGAWFIVRLVRAKPSLFPRSRLDPTLSINPYDLLHGWKFLKWVWMVTQRGVPKKPRAIAAIAPVYHIEPATPGGPGSQVVSPTSSGDARNSTRDNAALSTAELVANPIETPEEEEALNQAIVYGLGDGSVRVEDTEPLFVEQDESEVASDGEDETTETDSDEYVKSSDDESGYDSGYETADESFEIIVDASSEQNDTAMDTDTEAPMEIATAKEIEAPKERTMNKAMETDNETAPANQLAKELAADRAPEVPA
ncbi:hypothetical protein BJY01DRAFT_256225 [Aspergillus pseudoustus]|uniref:Uncharacterized protein n=1 Tax=Aspergillus pseudoustus TaxID=1810923 RepID=A0ABR4IE56_9EURO